MRRRLEVVAGIVALGMAMLVVRAVDLQWLQADHLQEIATKQRFHQFEITAPRGAITDRNGRTLAESIEVPSIAAIAPEVPQEKVPALARALDIPVGKLTARLKGRNGFVWLSRQVSPTMAEKVNAMDIPGIRIEHEWRRFQPMGPETGHVLGFVGIDGKGLEGLERSFNKRLGGEPGIRQVRRDARGHSLPGGVWLQEAKPGQNLQLTIDGNLQSIAYAALSEAVQSQHALGGSVVIMNPRDGSVLAMTNWPGYNPNNFREFRPGQWRNRAITDVFEPGSTMKPFTLAAAMQSGRWQYNSKIFCENGQFQVADQVIHDDHSEGTLDMTGLLARSSNIGAAKLALDIGHERLYQTLTQVGFDSKTGIGLGGESPGVMPPIDRWGPVETANIAFGQGIAVTPLQLATAFCVLANGGVYQQPRILNNAPENEGTRVFNRDIATHLRHMLEAATGSDGTGRLAVPDGYRIAGKTGTAQKPNKRGGYSKDRYMAVFAGFAPADNPELVIVVVIDEPKGSIYGGQVAAPVFRNIMASALPYLGIAPEVQAEPNMQILQVSNHDTPTLAGSLIGMSLREVRRAAFQIGARLHVHGTGWVSRQKPTATTGLQAGDTLEVWLNE